MIAGDELADVAVAEDLVLEERPGDPLDGRDVALQQPVNLCEQESRMQRGDLGVSVHRLGDGASVGVVVGRLVLRHRPPGVKALPFGSAERWAAGNRNPSCSVGWMISVVAGPSVRNPASRSAAAGERGHDLALETGQDLSRPLRRGLVQEVVDVGNINLAQGLVLEERATGPSAPLMNTGPTTGQPSNTADTQWPASCAANR